METKIKINTVNFPKLLADLSHSNQFLKMFSIIALGVATLALVVLTFLVTKAPTVLALSPAGQVLERRAMPKAEDEIKAATQSYIEKRYGWQPVNVEANLQTAEVFILPTALKAFRVATQNVARFSREKNVSQKVYADLMKVDLEKKTIEITGDRVTSIKGFKAAGDLRLELSFESGSRTKANPWGVYFSREKEESTD